MVIKTTFADRNNGILAAIVRALAAKAAGYQIAKDTTEGRLRQEGFYRFEFQRDRNARNFLTWIDEYLPKKYRDELTVVVERPTIETIG